ncbi:MAG: Fic family protein [Planctomycetaceae bacterium]
MQLTEPSEWSLDEATLGLLGDLDESAYLINHLRPLTPAVLIQVKEKLLGERVFSSNAIEGNTLTLRETTLILQTGSILSGPRRREAQEALNLGGAYRQIEQYTESPNDFWNQTTFLELHRKLMTSVNDDLAGHYRACDVMLPGAMYQPPGSHLVHDLMNHFYQVLMKTSLPESKPSHPLVLAAWVHWAIARIHPFEDGNGRMARLWQDLMLLRGRLTAAIIRPEDRESYYDSLTAADDGNCNPLMQLVCRRVQNTLQIYLTAQEEADELKDWAADLTGEMTTQAEQLRRLEYERWRHAVERIRDAFERCATLISSSGSRSLQVRVHRYDFIDQSVWERIGAGDWTRKTWFFRVWFCHERQTVSYIFTFGPHVPTDGDEAANIRGALVGLHVSEQNPGDQRVVLLEDLEGSPTSCRELLFMDNKLLRRRKADNDNFEYDDNVSAVQVAKEFIEDVISQKLVLSVARNIKS